MNENKNQKLLAELELAKEAMLRAEIANYHTQLELDRCRSEYEKKNYEALLAGLVSMN
jgi:hypothetical protein